MYKIIIVVIVVAMVVIFLPKQTKYVALETEIEEIVDIVEPTEEELRRLEWEKEAEEVRQRHIKRRELEHERSVLLQEVKERETRIKELEKELGF